MPENQIQSKPANAEQEGGKGLDETPCSPSSLTPETDAVNAQGQGYALRFYAMKTHARKMERQRNEARIHTPERLAAALWDCSALRHGMFTPPEFRRMCEEVLKRGMSSENS